MHAFDRRTDRETERILIAIQFPQRVHSMQCGKAMQHFCNGWHQVVTQYQLNLHHLCSLLTFGTTVIHNCETKRNMISKYAHLTSEVLTDIVSTLVRSSTDCDEQHSPQITVTLQHKRHLVTKYT